MWCDRELMNICCRNRLCRGLYYIVGKIATMAKNIYQGKCMLKKQWARSVIVTRYQNRKEIIK